MSFKILKCQESRRVGTSATPQLLVQSWSQCRIGNQLTLFATRKVGTGPRYNWVSHCLSPQVLPLEGLLRTGWNSRAYLRGVPAEGHRALVPEESTRANLTRLGQLMSSDTDWAYIEMICLLAEECELIGKWAEGCPCHLRRVPTQPLSGAGAVLAIETVLKSKPQQKRRKARIKLTQGDREAASCSFKCCRAPELATGQALALQQSTMDSHKSRINSIICRVPTNQRGELVASWSTARSRMTGQLTAKLSHWGELPWILCQVLSTGAELGRIVPSIICGHFILSSLGRDTLHAGRSRRLHVIGSYLQTLLLLLLLSPYNQNHCCKPLGSRSFPCHLSNYQLPPVKFAKSFWLSLGDFLCNLSIVMCIALH